jgi:uncharacterized 2Fe-2S/4Fe-4S cluster protein (DUF4445 family)
MEKKTNTDTATQSVFTLIVEPISKRLSVAANTTIYDAVLELHRPVNAACGGKGTCGKCRIRVSPHESLVSVPTEQEKKIFTAEELSNGNRLACQTRILGNCRIFLTNGFMEEKMQILTTGRLYNVQLRPRFWKVALNIKELTKGKVPISDFRTLKGAIYDILPILSVYNRTIDTSYECIKKIPKTIREQKGVVTVTLESTIGDDSQPIVLLDVEAGDRTQDFYGVAIDIGTTTVVGYLIDLTNGHIDAVESILNPQVSIGEDIITRLTYIQQHEDGLDHAQTLIKNAIDDLLARLVENVKATKDSIVEVCVAGNTAMHHIFFGFSTNYLGLAPYPPVIQQAISIRNYHYNFQNLDLNCEIYSLPNIAGFVGADVVAGIIATNLDLQENNSLLIDIGTNGELVLGCESLGLITASVAAGSALEGAHISNGMRGTIGAIETVKIDPKDWTPQIDVIGHMDPIGLCGSGIIDLVAELIRAGLVTRSGKFNTNHPNFNSHPRIRKGSNGYEYIIHSKKLPAKFLFTLKEGVKDIDSNREIVFTQDDLREVQKGKSAFLAGIRTLLKEQKTTLADLDQIFLAGAFGNYIKKENAHFIGLLPDIDLDRVHNVGNTSGIGAQIVLMNTNIRKRAEELYLKVKYVELADKESFQGEFARSMYFPHMDLDSFPSLKSHYEKVPER